MYKFEKLSARELTGVLGGLFETENQEREFIEVAEEKGATYSIDVEVIDGNYETEISQNTIYEDVGYSSNEVFFDVYISSEDLENLKNGGYKSV